MNVNREWNKQADTLAKFVRKSHATMEWDTFPSGIVLEVSPILYVSSMLLYESGLLSEK